MCDIFVGCHNFLWSFATSSIAHPYYANPGGRLCKQNYLWRHRGPGSRNLSNWDGRDFSISTDLRMAPIAGNLVRSIYHCLRGVSRTRLEGLALLWPYQYQSIDDLIGG